MIIPIFVQQVIYVLKALMLIQQLLETHTDVLEDIIVYRVQQQLLHAWQVLITQVWVGPVVLHD